MSRRRKILVNMLAAFLTAVTAAIPVALNGAPRWGIAAVVVIVYLVVLPVRGWDGRAQ